MQNLYDFLTTLFVGIATVGGVIGFTHLTIKGALVTGRMDFSDINFNSIQEYYLKAVGFLVISIENQFRDGGIFRVVSIIASVSIAYTIVVFFLGWALGASGATGNVQILPPFESDYGRFIFAFIFLTIAAFTFLSVVYDSNVHSFIFSIFGKLPVQLLLGAFGAIAVFVTWTVVVEQLPAGLSSLPTALGVPEENILLAINLVTAALVFGLFLVSRNPLTILNYTLAACFGYWADLPLTIFFPLALVLAWPLTGPVPVLVSVFVSPIMIALLTYVLPLDVALIIGAFFPAWIAIILAGSGKKTASRIAVLGLIGFFELFPMGVGVYLRGYELDIAGAVSVFFLWSVVPSVNIVFDLISWWITWMLLVHLLQSFRTYSGGVAGKIGISAGHILVDAVVALILIPCLILGTLFSVRVFNSLLTVGGIEQSLDIVPLLQAGVENPFGPETMWFSVMIFSTIIPTLVHFVIVVSGLLFSILPSRIAMPTNSATTVGAGGEVHAGGVTLERTAYTATAVILLSLGIIICIVVLLGNLIEILGVAPQLVYQLALYLSSVVG